MLLCMGSCSRQGFTAPAGRSRKGTRLKTNAAAMAPAIQGFTPSHRDVAASSPWACSGLTFARGAARDGALEDLSQL